MSLLRRVTVMIAALALPSTAHAAWQEAKSKHFIIYGDQKPEELLQFAERLERFDQAVRHVRGMDDPALTDAARLNIYVLRNEYSVGRLAGNRSVAGFYNARASGAVAFVPRKSSGDNRIWDLDAEAIFFHEYAHHLQLQFASGAIPSWMVEGFAEFFATADVKDDGSVIIGRPPQYRAWSLFMSDALSLEQMLGGTYRKLRNEQVGELYGEGWLLTHYLNFNAARKGQLAKYYNAIQQGQPALDAGKAAFGDLSTLNRELEKYKRGKIGAVVVDAKDLSIGPIAIRPLGPGEAAIMDVNIRSTRGVSEETAPSVAADARKIAAAYPNDPFAQAVLAEAEFDAKNYAEAESAADRALAANPNNVHALIYKGQAQMALAEANPDKADWKAIRGWFTKANKLDTENAEPLMLYYQTYVHQGAKPTKNAVNALLYAAALAPLDTELRLMAVRQLLNEEQPAKAKDLFAPLAYRPHLDEKWREVNGQIMDAIAKADSRTALSLMDAAQKFAEEEAKKP